MRTINLNLDPEDRKLRALSHIITYDVHTYIHVCMCVACMYVCMYVYICRSYLNSDFVFILPLTK